MGTKICKKCGKSKTYPDFKFTGKGKAKKGIAGNYRSENCLSCTK